MSKENFDRDFTFQSFESGLNIPVPDIHTLLVENYLRFRNPKKILKVSGIETIASTKFSTKSIFFLPPIFQIRVDENHVQRYEGIENIIEAIETREDLSLRKDLSPSVDLEMQQMVNFLHGELFPVVVFYWFNIPSHFEIFRKEISKQINFPKESMLMNFFRKRTIVNEIRNIYIEKYLKETSMDEFDVYKKFQECIKVISEWIEKKNRRSREFLLTNDQPMYVDVLLYTLLSCIYFTTPFNQFLELKYVLKKEEELQIYLNHISKKYYVKFRQMKPTFHDIGVGMNINENELELMKNKVKEKRKTAFIWIGACIVAFSLYAGFRKKIPVSVFSPLIWILKRYFGKKKEDIEHLELINEKKE